MRLVSRFSPGALLAAPRGEIEKLGSYLTVTPGHLTAEGGMSESAPSG